MTDEEERFLLDAAATLPVAVIEHLPLRTRPSRVRLYPPPWQSEPVPEDVVKRLIETLDVK